MSALALDRSHVQQLPGAARAAILLLAMGQTGAARLIKHLTPEELRALRRGAADRLPVSAPELDDLVSEFQEAFRVGPGLSALDREMSSLLEGALTQDELSAVYADERGDVIRRSVYEALADMGAEGIVERFQSEHPQLIALVLGRLEPDLAAAVCAGLEPSTRNEVLRRMLVVATLEPAAELALESNLRDVFLADDARSGRGARHQSLAEIVNRMDKAQGEETLAVIAETAPEDAIAIRRLMFAFEDLPSLAKRARLVLFDDVSVDIVTNALVGTEAELRETILSSLAARTRRMVEAELSSGREIDAREITGARRQIAALALRFAREGRIALPNPTA